jgi:hypothetical protein
MEYKKLVVAKKDLTGTAQKCVELDRKFSTNQSKSKQSG